MNSSDAQRPLDILALHGGGFMAFHAAVVIEKVEAFCTKAGHSGSVSTAFHCLSGTSAGAILAAGLASGVSGSKLAALMEVFGPSIFPRRLLFNKWPGIFAARFDPAPLACLLDEILEGRCFGDLDRHLVIPAIDLTGARPVIFSTANPELQSLPLRDAVLASAAAPLYFPPHRIGNNLYVDGGMIANGPAIVASREMASVERCPVSDQRIVTIGTTRKPWADLPSSAGWGLRNWVFQDMRLIRVFMEHQVALQSTMLKMDRPALFIEIDSELEPRECPHVDLAQAGPKAQQILREAAERSLRALSPEEILDLEMILARAPAAPLGRQCDRERFAAPPSGAA